MDSQFKNDDDVKKYLGLDGCVLAIGCPEGKHRDFEIKLFQNPNGVLDNSNNWPIRLVLSSYYMGNGNYKQVGIPDGKSDCNACTSECGNCKNSIPYKQAYDKNKCGYGDINTGDYTRVHRDVAIINSMRKWMNMGAVNGNDIGLPDCK
jgi:alpha-amylase